ncbi:hypothetical protein ACWKXX_07680 [Enterobacter sp. UPMP2061]
MAMDIFAGSHIRAFIGTNGATVATDFKEIPELASFVMGSKESTVIDVVTYNQSYNRKLLGTQSIANIDLQVNLLPDNEVHQLLQSHFTDQTRCQIRLEAYENGTMTTGFYETYRAFVSTATTEGSKDEVVKATFTLAIDGAPLEEGLLPKGE